MNKSTEDRKPRPADLVAAYELGLLSDQESAEFEALLLRDPEILEDLYAMAPHSRAMVEDPARYRAEIRAALAASSPSLLGRLRRYLSDLTAPRVLVPVATVAVLAVLISIPHQGILGLGDLAVVEPLPYVQLDLRSGSQKVEQLFTSAMSQYTEGHYDEAASNLQSAVTSAEPMSEPQLLAQAYLYLGLSLLLADRPEEAIAPLQVAAQSAVLPVAERSRWYLAQARLLTGEAEEAELLLSELATSSPVYGDPAARQLGQLQRFLPHH